MSLHTDLPIYKTGIQLLSLAIRVQQQMPRGVKRSLGDRISQYCVDMLDLMALANATKHGERAGQAPRVPGLDKPLGTVVAGAAKHALVAAFLAKHYTGVVGSDLEDPIGTVTATDHHSLVASNLVKLRGTSNSAATDEPLHTISAGGQHHAEVRAMLTKYYGTGEGQGVDEPLHTVTTKPRFGLVTVAGEQYSIADIGMRMLQPRELYNAQGFPASYIIDRGADGRVLPKDAQVRMCGNSVCPPLSRALVAANYAEHQALRAAA